MAEGPSKAARIGVLVAVGVVASALLALLLVWTVHGLENPGGRPAFPDAAERPPVRRAPAPATQEPPPPSPGAPPDEPPPPVVPRVVVAGAVFDAEDRPASRALVWVAVGPEEEAPIGVTTEEGRYELEVPVGEHEIRARGEGTGTASAAIAPTAGEGRLAAPDLHLPRGSVIRGRVVDGAGRPRRSVRVRCRSEDDRADPVGETRLGGGRFILGGDEAETDGEGRFTLRGLAGGRATYRVHPDLAGTPYLKSDPPDRTGVKADGESVDFRVAGRATVRGIVVDSLTGEPVPFFTVGRSSFDAEDGRFELEVGEDRKVEVSVLGYRSAWIPVQDPSGEAGERRIALEPAEESGVLVLLVTGDGGAAVARIEGLGVLDGFPVWGRSIPGAGGEFRVGRTPSGEQTVRVSADGWSAQTRKVVVPKGGEARLEVTLQRSGSARVRILDAAGNVLRSPREVSLLDPDGMGPCMDWIEAKPRRSPVSIGYWHPPGKRGGIRIDMTECDGRIVGLLPGAYRLVVGTRDATGEAEFSIAAGEETAVTIRLEK